MNKVIASFILLAIAIGVKANTLANDTVCYHYYAANSSVDGKRVSDMFDEILLLVRNGSTTKCLYYGPSVEFDNSPEPFLPGFITLEATDLTMNDGRICFRLNPTGRKYFSQPVELQLHTEREILDAGYHLWLQAPVFFWLDVMCEGTYNDEQISISNKTLRPEETKVFYKEPISLARSVYKRDLITTEDELQNR